MLKAMKVIWERMMRLEDLMGLIPEHEDHSINERLELAIKITEKVAR
jgi:hypothetical protein